jgi:23S rRNA (adenine2503-C2)-methyltransferase
MATPWRCRKRRVTLSTAGVVPMIPRAGNEIGSSLAISLHAVRDEIRDEIVPINKKYPIAEADRGLPHLSRRFQCPAHHLRICDAEGRQRHLADARALVKLVAGIPAKINLIPVQSLARRAL